MYVVVGANGFLGSYIVRTLIEKTKEKILAVSHSQEDLKANERISVFSCDIAVQAQVNQLSDLIAQSKEPVKLIYLAAYHNPDLVESNPKFAWNVNITSLAYFLNRITNVTSFFYPSTDTVYGNGGVEQHFCEGDPLSPVNLYGKQKALAESMVLTYGYNVVRFPFLIGKSILSRKKHFYDQIVETILSGNKIEMYADSYRSSLDFGTASELLVALMERHDEQMPSIINVSGDQDLSKYDIGCLIAQKYGISSELIVPISIKENNNIFQIPRAESTLMDNQLLKNVLQVEQIKIHI